MSRTPLSPVTFCLLFLLLFPSLPVFAASAEVSEPGSPPITIACMVGNEPLSFISPSGEPAGLLIDLWRLWAEKIGRPVKFLMGDWQTTLDDLHSGRADIHFGMYITPERSRWAKFGPSIYPGTAGILMSSAVGADVTNLGQLGTATIAVLKGSYQEEYLREHFPKLQLVHVGDGTEMLMAVVNGRAQGVAANFPSTYGTVDRLGLNSFFMPHALKLFERNVHPAVLKDREDLFKLVDSGFARITRAEMMSLESRWVRSLAQRVWGAMQRPLRLDQTERAWLAAHPVLRIGLEKNWPPLEFADAAGEVHGLSVDAMHLIANVLGVSAQPQVMDDKGEAPAPRMVDVIPLPDASVCDDGQWQLTRPFLRLPLAVVTEDTHRLITSPLDLAGKTVAVHDHARLAQYLREQLPDSTIVPVKNLDEGLATVQTGATDALVGISLSIEYTLANRNIKDLRPGLLPQMAYSAPLAVRGDWPVLLSILNKALDSMPPDEFNVIVSRWANLRVERAVDWGLLAEVGGVALLLVASVLSVILIWNRKLARESLERKKALEEVQASAAALEQGKHQLRSIVDNLPSLVMLKDPEGRYIMVNRFFETFTGCQEADVVGKDNTAVLPPELCAEGTLHDRQVMESGQMLRTEENRPDAAGTLHTLEVIRVPLCNAAGKAYGMVFMGIDITERLASEQEIRRAQAELRQIFNAAGSAMRVIDRNMNVVEVNDTYVKYYGYSREEMLGRWCGEHPGGDTCGIDCIGRRILNGEARAATMQKRRKKDGSVVYCSLVATPFLSPEGELRGIIEDCRDITELMESQKAAEEARKAAEEAQHVAEEASKAKSEFLANMSHEIRTPMNAVVGLTHLALRTHLTETQRNYLRNIDSSAKALLRIINDILDFSKIEAGRLEMEHMPFDLEEVLLALSSLDTAKPGGTHLELLLRIDPDVPLSFMGDPLRLSQILTNLVGNAIKFTPRGEIVVRVELVAMADGKATLRFSVRDTGIGMNPDQVGKLFQAFTQADSSTTRRFGGTGLGLSISKRMVELMGGEIGATSELGKGSTFFFTVVFNLADNGRRRTIPSAEALKGLRVLVVDDSTSSREILSQELQYMALRPGQACDGDEALQEILRAANENDPYDLVLMDWKMPGKDGIEVARLLRACRDLPRIPTVIMVTAYGRDEVMEKAHSEGINYFLIKPVSPSLLLHTIQDVFGQSDEGEAQIGQQPRLSSELPEIRGKRVLLAEDNEINQLVGKELLESMGLEVDIATNGLEAVEKTEQGDYAAVFMDIHMPEIDGLEAAQRLRAQARFASLPIIALTADNMVGDREKSLAAGMNDHISKPIDPQQLMAVVRRWLLPLSKHGA